MRIFLGRKILGQSSVAFDSFVGYTIVYGIVNESVDLDKLDLKASCKKKGAHEDAVAAVGSCVQLH